GRTLVDQPSFEWRADPVGDPGAPGSGVLLPEPGAGTRPRVFSNESVKDVPGRFVNHVMGLDTKEGLNGTPAQVFLCTYSIVREGLAWPGEETANNIKLVIGAS